MRRQCARRLWIVSASVPRSRNTYASAPMPLVLRPAAKNCCTADFTTDTCRQRSLSVRPAPASTRRPRRGRRQADQQQPPEAGPPNFCARCLSTPTEMRPVVPSENGATRGWSWQSCSAVVVRPRSRSLSRRLSPLSATHPLVGTAAPVAAEAFAAFVLAGRESAVVAVGPDTGDLPVCHREDMADHADEVLAVPREGRELLDQHIVVARGDRIHRLGRQAGAAIDGVGKAPDQLICGPGHHSPRGVAPRTCHLDHEVVREEGSQPLQVLGSLSLACALCRLDVVPNKDHRVEGFGLGHMLIESGLHMARPAESRSPVRADMTGSSVDRRLDATTAKPSKPSKAGQRHQRFWSAGTAEGLNGSAAPALAATGDPQRPAGDVVRSRRRSTAGTTAGVTVDTTPAAASRPATRPRAVTAATRRGTAWQLFRPIPPFRKTWSRAEPSTKAAAPLSEHPSWGRPASTIGPPELP
jgi:hypothetical protein